MNINEIRLPEIEAPLVARAVAEQIERRVSHRRAIKQAAMRAMQRGAQGVRIRIAGRLGGSDMSRTDQERQGRVPLHTLKADVDYGTSEAQTTLGRIGVKVWIYKGDKVTERTGAAAQRRCERARAASGKRRLPRQRLPPKHRLPPKPPKWPRPKTAARRGSAETVAAPDRNLKPHPTEEETDASA